MTTRTTPVSPSDHPMRMLLGSRKSKIMPVKPLRKKVLKNLLALGFGLVIAVICSEVVLLLLPVHRLPFRPHNYLVSNDLSLRHRIYQKGADVTFQLPFGDLATIDSTADIDRQPRTVRYVIDAYGFRNNHEYKPGDLLLVGDSFIVGEGNTQQDILSSQLQERGIRSYNLAFPGDLGSYVQYINQFWPHVRDSKVAVFLFEGNDFPDEAIEQFSYGLVKDFLKRVGRKFKDLYAYRFLYVSYYNTKVRLLKKNSQLVQSAEIHDQRVGFFNNYVKVALRTSYQGSPEFEQALRDNAQKINYIFFIPDKYRVYYNNFGDPHKPPLPQAQWDYVAALARKYHIVAVDLTPALINKAQQLLIEKGQFIWWKDDTHWNKEGMLAAADVIAQTLKSQ